MTNFAANATVTSYPTNVTVTTSGNQVVQHIKYDFVNLNPFEEKLLPSTYTRPTKGLLYPRR